MILSNREIQAASDSGRLVVDPEPRPRAPASPGVLCPDSTSAVDLTPSDEIACFRPLPILLDPEAAICQLIVEEVRGFPFKNPRRFQNQTTAGGA